jgi:hypothetical protein
MHIPYSHWLLLITTLLIGACERQSENSAEGTPSRYELPTAAEIKQREDGLSYLKGSDEPYHGPLVRIDSRRGLRHFAMYQNGLLNGPEITFYDNGLMRRIIDYRDGKKDRIRDYYENGHPWRDAAFENDFAWGRHLKWHENGRLGFVGTMHQDKESMKWHGPITDHDENGELIVDAIFDEGKYVGGVFPLERAPKPKPSGKRWQWED